jgi:hypothetical protein
MAIYGTGAPAARTRREYGDFTAPRTVYGGVRRGSPASAHRYPQIHRIYRDLRAVCGPPLKMENHHINGRSMADPARPRSPRRRS